jgi:hypothetical protein
MLTIWTTAFCVAAVLDNTPLQWFIILSGLLIYFTT